MPARSQNGNAKYSGIKSSRIAQETAKALERCVLVKFNRISIAQRLHLFNLAHQGGAVL
jgi:hypothetical protein